MTKAATARKDRTRRTETNAAKKFKPSDILAEGSRRLSAKADDRVSQLKRARAIIAVATLSSWRNSFGHYDAPNYYKIASTLGLTKDDADLADKIWNDANGADEGTETEDHAMERVAWLLSSELGE